MALRDQLLGRRDRLAQPGITFSALIERRAAPHLGDARRRAFGNLRLEAGIASTAEERRAAAALVESRYASRGYRVANLARATESELTLIADEDGATVGTLTIRLDGPKGLRADESYREHIDAVRAVGKGVCELGQFAVASDARSTPVLAALFARAYELVCDLRDVTDVFIEVNPRHVEFYRKLFGFAVAAGGRICPRVRAPSVLLRLEVAAFEARLRAYATALWPQRGLIASPALN
jgi:hypothetical protein